MNIIQIKYLQLETKAAIITDGDPFPRNIVPLNNGTLFLQCMGGYTTTLIKYSRCICWFDSHNRDVV